MRSFREARLETGVSLTVCARRSGLDRSTVASAQSGASKPKPSTALKLAAAIGADPHEIEELAPAVRDFEKVGA